MAKSLEGVLVVAVSSRALFDFEEENSVFEDPSKGETEYMSLQWEKLSQPANPGVGFNLCRKLLALNEPNQLRAEVVVLSRNDPISGLRVFNSAQHHHLPVSRGVFVGGEPPFRYLKPLEANLFLSANNSDVRHAIDAGYPAASVCPRTADGDLNPNELRIAFDGDSVLFSDQAEQVYRKDKQDGFNTHEVEHCDEPLPVGPFQSFLVALHKIQQSLGSSSQMAVKTALITARGAPSHLRAMKTLKHWNVRVDQAFFLDGLAKTGFLEEFQPDFFFDDQLHHIETAKAIVSAGHVPYGIANQAATESKDENTRS